MIMIFMMIQNSYAESDVTVTATYDAENVEIESVMAVYDGEDKLSTINRTGPATIFIKAKKDDVLMLLMEHRILKRGNNVILFDSKDSTKEHIIISENVHPMGDSVFIDFMNVAGDSSVELKLKAGSEQEVILSNTLDYLIAFTDVRGDIGINIFTNSTTHFYGDYSLSLKRKWVTMKNRPSFNELFKITYGQGERISDMFMMNRAGGCDYKYYDKEGTLVMDKRFGMEDNPLHFENLSDGLYDMTFSFNKGDLELTAKDVQFIFDDKDIISSKAFKEIVITTLPISTNGIDFHELMTDCEPHIVFNLMGGTLDGNIFNQDEIDLFSKNNKTFTVKNDFVEIYFDQEAIKEMSEVNYDLSMHIFKGEGLKNRDKLQEFLMSVYNNVEKMQVVGDYNIQIFLNDYDLICGEWSNRPTITLTLTEEELSGINFKKVKAYTSFDTDKEIDQVYGINTHNSITMRLQKAISYPYINLYEHKENTLK